jgi:hypothetical protein
LANGTIVAAGNINLPWSAGTWGQCPGTGTYQICVSTNAADPCVGGTNVSAISDTQLNYTYVQSNYGTYYWKVGVNNGTGLPTAFSGIGSFIINVPSTLTTTTLTNSDNQNVVLDSGGLAHICKTDFTNSSVPRRAKFVFTLSDLNGWADIISTRMRWNGNVYNAVLSGGSGNSTTATVTVDFVSANNGTLTYPVEIQITDGGGSTAYIDTNIDWKVWDCNIPVSGNVYDSSSSTLGAQCTTGEGYTDLADASMNFNYVDFVPTSGSTVRVNAVDDSAYSGGSLLWGKIYTATPNSDLVGGTPIVRWVDTGVGTTSCGTQMSLINTVINPYSSIPSLVISFASAAAQDPWYQVENGGIQAATTISNIVPITCILDTNCVSAFAKTNNSLLSAVNINNGGCVLGTSDCQYGNPNNWYINSATLSSAEKYDYRYFYDKYFLGYGGGTTLPSGATMTNVKSVVVLVSSS